jgi:hypothetical protein
MIRSRVIYIFSFKRYTGHTDAKDCVPKDV